jgi:hypothetical protein
MPSNQKAMILDKLGRLIHIHDRPGGWKLSPFERDTIYQRFLAQFPDKRWDTDHAWGWMKLEAKRWPISPKRVRDFIHEAVKAERGSIDRSWAWWVGCSMLKGKKQS